QPGPAAGLLARHPAAVAARGGPGERGVPAPGRPELRPAASRRIDPGGPDDLHEPRPAAPAPGSGGTAQFHPGDRGPAVTDPLPEDAHRATAAPHAAWSAVAADLAPLPEPPLADRPGGGASCAPGNPPAL